MSIYIKHYDEGDSLTHYGVKGMKWKHHKLHGNGLSSEYVKEYLSNRGGTESLPSLKKNSTMSSRKMTSKERAKSKIDSVLSKSKKKLRKAEHDTRFGVYNATRKVMKKTGYSSKYSPQEVVKLKKKKREKEYAKNRRAHKVAAKISGINKYLNK